MEQSCFEQHAPAAIVAGIDPTSGDVVMAVLDEHNGCLQMLRKRPPDLRH